MLAGIDFHAGRGVTGDPVVDGEGARREFNFIADLILPGVSESDGGGGSG